MRMTLIALAGIAAITGACTERLVVDATGVDVPETAIYQSTVGGADGIVSPGEELKGRVLNVETSTTTNRFVFLESNVFRIEDPSGSLVVQGSYQVEGSDICVDWAPRGSECWPKLMTATNTPEIFTSDRGQAIRAFVIDS